MASEANLQDRALELEALEALYTHENEFNRISEDTFILNLEPFPDGETTNLVNATLRVTFTDDYPDVPPDWEIEKSKGLDSESIGKLEELIRKEIQRNLGCSMIYSVAEAISDWLRLNNKPSQSMHDQMMKRMSGKADDEPYVRYAGHSEGSDDSDDEIENTNDPQYKQLEDRPLCAATDRVTKEEFEQWSKKFRLEMINSGLWKCSTMLPKGVLTGRQLFESDASLAQADNQDEDGKEASAFWKDESLFAQNLDDLPEED